MHKTDVRRKHQILGLVLLGVAFLGLAAGIWGFVAKSQTEAILSRADVRLQLAFDPAARAEVGPWLNKLLALGISGLVIGFAALVAGVVVLVTLPQARKASESFATTSVPVFCPACDAFLELDDQFCGSCGASIRGAPAPGRSAPPMGRYDRQ